MIKEKVFNEPGIIKLHKAVNRLNYFKAGKKKRMVKAYERKVIY